MRQTFDYRGRSGVGYVPLIDVSPKNGEAAVLFAALQSAGFDVVTECDVRGWMCWYRPFMSLIRPVTIWVPESQLGDAREYIDAPVECTPIDRTAHAGFWAIVRSSRGPVSAAYVLLILLLGF